MKKRNALKLGDVIILILPILAILWIVVILRPDMSEFLDWIQNRSSDTSPNLSWVKSTSAFIMLAILYGSICIIRWLFQRRFKTFDIILLLTFAIGIIPLITQFDRFRANIDDVSTAETHLINAQGHLDVIFFMSILFVFVIIINMVIGMRENYLDQKRNEEEKIREEEFIKKNPEYIRILKNYMKKRKDFLLFFLLALSTQLSFGQYINQGEDLKEIKSEMERSFPLLSGRTFSFESCYYANCNDTIGSAIIASEYNQVSDWSKPTMREYFGNTQILGVCAYGGHVPEYVKNAKEGLAWSLTLYGREVALKYGLPYMLINKLLDKVPTKGEEGFYITLHENGIWEVEYYGIPEGSELFKKLIFKRKNKDGRVVYHFLILNHEEYAPVPIDIRRVVILNPEKAAEIQKKYNIITKKELHAIGWERTVEKANTAKMHTVTLPVYSNGGFMAQLTDSTKLKEIGISKHYVTCFSDRVEFSFNGDLKEGTHFIEFLMSDTQTSDISETLTLLVNPPCLPEIVVKKDTVYVDSPDTLRQRSLITKSFIGLGTYHIKMRMSDSDFKANNLGFGFTMHNAFNIIRKKKMVWYGFVGGDVLKSVKGWYDKKFFVDDPTGKINYLEATPYVGTGIEAGRFMMEIGVKNIYVNHRDRLFKQNNDTYLIDNYVVERDFSMFANAGYLHNDLAIRAVYGRGQVSQEMKNPDGECFYLNKYYHEEAGFMFDLVRKRFSFGTSIIYQGIDGFLFNSERSTLLANLRWEIKFKKSPLSVRHNIGYRIPFGFGSQGLRFMVGLTYTPEWHKHEKQ